MALIAFRYTQPFLINSTIRYVIEPVTEADEDDFTGYYLIAGAFVVYVGSAVGNSYHAR